LKDNENPELPLLPPIDIKNGRVDTNPEWLSQWHKILVRTVPLILFVIGRHFWIIILSVSFVGCATFYVDNFLYTRFDCHSNITFIAVPRGADTNITIVPEQEKQWALFVSELAQAEAPRLLEYSLQNVVSTKPVADLSVSHNETTIAFTVSSTTPERAARLNANIYSNFGESFYTITRTNASLVLINTQNDPAHFHFSATLKLTVISFCLILFRFLFKESYYYETIKNPSDITDSTSLMTIGFIRFKKDFALTSHSRHSSYRDGYRKPNLRICIAGTSNHD
jgi:hypothetical protein